MFLHLFIYLSLWEIFLAGKPQHNVHLSERELLYPVFFLHLPDDVHELSVILEFIVAELDFPVSVAQLAKHSIHIRVVDGVCFRIVVRTELGGEGVEILFGS